jgi:hypothetical protein
MLAMALQALWPLIAQARPVTLVPVCTVGGETHYVEIPGKPSPADSHCELCFMGAALPGVDSVSIFDAFASASPNAAAFSSRTFFHISAAARAPPVLPTVHSNNDNGRTNEKASAFSAADPHRGGGFVRLGVLHG